MKTTIVTGACGAIGSAIVAGIASLQDYHVVMTGRNAAQLEKLKAELAQEYPGALITAKVLDVSLKKEVHRFAAEWDGQLHLLINNAATAPRKRVLTSEGIEVQLATNILGYFWMMEKLYPFMKGTEDPRIVNVASYWAGGLDLLDLEFKRRPYDNDVAYRQSKQANRMLTAGFAERLKAYGISVNACHPGDVNSKLSNDLGFGGHETPDEGASTPVFLATSSLVQGISGRYFVSKKAVNCEYAQKKQEIQKLLDVLGSY